jgi:hypothetical protein
LRSKVSVSERLFLKNSRDDEKRCQPLIFDRVPKKKDLRDDDDDDGRTLAMNEKERKRESAKRRRAFKGKRRTFSLSLSSRLNVREKSTERKNAPDPRDLSRKRPPPPGKKEQKKKRNHAYR